MRPDRELLDMLRNAGRDEAHRWLGHSKSAIGRRSSVDLGARFLGPLQPFIAPEPVAASSQQQRDAEAIADKL